MLQGVEGYPELSISAPTPARELRGGHVTPLTFRPQDIGMHFGSYQSMSTASFTEEHSRSEQEAGLVMKVLQNQIRGDHRAWLLLNAALFIYAAGKASSLQEAAPLAQQALDSGAAMKTLHTLAANKFIVPENLSPSTAAVPG